MAKLVAEFSEPLVAKAPESLIQNMKPQRLLWAYCDEVIFVTGRERP
jgi:hypothetical protein